MHKAVAVIGMNFGDEGKGHITNFFSDDDTLNIRFNGGCQAAHSVFLSDGRNHIFHLFGSGSMQKARTLFASHLIVNPILFVAEWAALSKKTDLREVFVDPRCRITTPYDMFINEFSCYYRKKNDSTGFGINETVERSQFRQLRISMRDLIDKSEVDIFEVLRKIRTEYIPWRLEQLNLPRAAFDDFLHYRIVDLNQIDDSFCNTIKAMLKFIVVWPDDNLADRYLEKGMDRRLVFEGAQGFRIDQNRTKLMPYLTRSNTGLQNIFDCLRTVKTPLDLDVYLVTRTYLTRHGDGFLWNEVKLPYNKIEELTNIENPYQGKMRYGYLNKAWYDAAIKETREYMEQNTPKCVVRSNLHVAFTCMDHVDDSLIYSDDGSNDFISGSIDDFQMVKLVSNGMTDRDIRMI